MDLQMALSLLASIGARLRQFKSEWFHELEGEEGDDSDRERLAVALERTRVRMLQQDLKGFFEDALNNGHELSDLPTDETSRVLAKEILRGLSYDELLDVTPSIDFSLETRRRIRLVTDVENRALLHFLMRISGEPDFLARDNHDHGYHFHYVRGGGRKQRRTNVLLTFHPEEPPGPPDCLFWEWHGNYVPVDPSLWGQKRKITVHTTAASSLRSLHKSSFVTPGKSAQQLICR